MADKGGQPACCLCPLQAPVPIRAPMIKLEVGEKIGDYRVIEFIARGGFSLVYLAENEEGRKYALKVGDVAGYIDQCLSSTPTA